MIAGRASPFARRALNGRDQSGLDGRVRMIEISRGDPTWFLRVLDWWMFSLPHDQPSRVEALRTPQSRSCDAILQHITPFSSTENRNSTKIRI